MSRDDLVGTRYRLEERLGRGGFSDVWRAVDTETGTVVALKLSATYADEAGFDAQELLREASVLQRLDHPNIVRVLDSGEDGGRAFIAMEYLEGPSLRTLIHTKGPMEPETVARIGAQVADALDVVHGHGIVHGDIKPENLILTGVESHLVDFGVAKDLSRTLRPEDANQLAGTLAYLAPELLQEGTATVLSDIYALGVTLYEALTGQLPLPDRRPGADLDQLEAARSRLQRHRASLDDVVALAISPTTWLRPGSAAEFQEALSVPTAIARPTERIVRPSMPAIGSRRKGAATPQRPRRWAAAGLVLGAVAVLAVSAGAWSLYAPRDSSSAESVIALQEDDASSASLEGSGDMAALATEGLPANPGDHGNRPDAEGKSGADGKQRGGGSTKQEEKAQKRAESHDKKRAERATERMTSD